MIHKRLEYIQISPEDKWKLKPETMITGVCYFSPILSSSLFLQNISHKPRKENSKLENGKQTTPRVEPVADQESEKDKEIARLKLQNAQIKMR